MDWNLTYTKKLDENGEGKEIVGHLKLKLWKISSSQGEHECLNVASCIVAIRNIDGMITMNIRILISYSYLIDRLIFLVLLISTSPKSPTPTTDTPHFTSPIIEDGNWIRAELSSRRDKELIQWHTGKY